MLKITVYNVGQASSILLDFGGGRFAVVDCGVNGSPSNPLVEDLRARVAENPRAIILFVLLTHLDLDHINGLADFLAEEALARRVRRLFCNDAEFRALLELVRRTDLVGSGVSMNPSASRGLRALAAVNGLIASPPRGRRDFHSELVAPTGSDPTEYPVELRVEGLAPEFRVVLFAPSQDLRNGVRRSLNEFLAQDLPSREILAAVGRRRVDWNSASAVLAIEHGGRRVLLGGDANSSTWSDILARETAEEQLKSDVVVAWHHGARLGSSQGVNLDEKVWSVVLDGGGQRKKHVLASHGRGNRYNHPHPEVIQLVETLKGEVLCTQLRRGSQSRTQGELTAFRRVGLALGWDPREEVEYFRTDRDSCCGDISVQVEPNGDIAVHRSRSLTESARHPCCCCAHGAD